MDGIAGFSIVAVPLLAIWIWVTIRGRDFWPFSHYPMFAANVEPAALVVYRISLETAEGELHWWRPAFEQLSEQLGRQLGRLHRRDITNPESRQANEARRLRLLRAMFRVIEDETGSARRYTAIRLVRRTIVDRPRDGWMVADTVVARVPVAGVMLGRP